MVEVFSFLTLLTVKDLKQECRLSFISFWQAFRISCSLFKRLENMKIENIHTIVVSGDVLYDDF